MNRTIFSQLAIGILLAAAGLTFFALRKNDVTVSAQTVTPYSSTWTASKILTVEPEIHIGDPGLPPRQTYTNGQAGLGVWEWQVAGTVGTKTFNETWTAPSITGVTMSGVDNANPDSSNRGCAFSGVDQIKLMVGCYNIKYGELTSNGRVQKATYKFAVRDVVGYSGTKQSGGPNAGAGRQATTSCVSSSAHVSPEPAECVSQSGAYSFQRMIFRIVPDPNNRDALVGGGTLMPLVWTVSGTVQN